MALYADFLFPFRLPSLLLVWLLLDRHLDLRDQSFRLLLKKL